MIIETENKNLLRDTETRAILNADNAKRMEFREKNAVKQLVTCMEQRIHNLENSMEEIKGLLIRLANK